MSDKKSDQTKIQGEGDKESAAKYNKATREYVESGQVDEAAERASEQDPKEAARAEAEGRARAKEKDPALHRDYRKPT